MFDREIKFNQFFLSYFDKVVADIPADRICERAPGGGHPPIWVLGHLAIVAEMGQSLLGGQLQHPDWVTVFGPVSSDEVIDAGTFAKDEFVDQVQSEYPRLSEMLQVAKSSTLEQPHGVALLEGTPIATVADIEVHLLTTHFSFHLAQLSVWRRAAGMGPLV